MQENARPNTVFSSEHKRVKPVTHWCGKRAKNSRAKNNTKIFEGHIVGNTVKTGGLKGANVYEIEKELGIEPPDLEGIWNENLRIQKEKEQEEEYIKQQNEFKIVYHYIPQYESIKPMDENVQ